MATGRMISKSISTSERVTALYAALKKTKDPSFGVLLFTWIQPHTDDWGRCDGSAFWIKYNVVPTLGHSEGDISTALAAMADVGLIHWYEIDGKKYIQIIDFERHQTGLHKRTNSTFPEFPGTSGNFREFPAEGNRTEEKRTEEKRALTRAREEVPPKQKRGSKENVPISDDEYIRLCQDYGKFIIDQYIEKLSLYLASKGKTYKDYAATVRAWLLKDGVQKVSRSSEKQPVPVAKKIYEEPDDKLGKCPCGSAYRGWYMSDGSDSGFECVDQCGRPWVPPNKQQSRAAPKVTNNRHGGSTLSEIFKQTGVT